MNDSEYMRRVRMMEGQLYRIAQAILWREADCMDAVQEAVFRGWMKKERLRESERLEIWLTRILVNQCRDMLRRRGREPEAIYGDISEADRLCEDLHLRQALKKLPEKYRLPLILHHLEGFSIEEISGMLEIPKKLVTSRLYQARRALKSLLEGDD